MTAVQYGSLFTLQEVNIYWYSPLDSLSDLLDACVGHCECHYDVESEYQPFALVKEIMWKNMFYFVFLPMAVDDGQKDRDIFCHLENVGNEANL